MTESAALIAARKGMAALDAYQSANLGAPLDFGGVDFGKPENEEIDFTGFEFKTETDFSEVNFGNPNQSHPYKPARFEKCLFNKRVLFNGATFQNDALFI